MEGHAEMNEVSLLSDSFLQPPSGSARFLAALVKFFLKGQRDAVTRAQNPLKQMTTAAM